MEGKFCGCERSEIRKSEIRKSEDDKACSMRIGSSSCRCALPNAAFGNSPFFFVRGHRVTVHVTFSWWRCRRLCPQSIPGGDEQIYNPVKSEVPEL